MSQIVDLLKQTCELEKVAYTEFVKTVTASTIEQLVSSGVPFEKAAGLVKAACEESAEIRGRVQNIEMLEKTAAYIEDLEGQLEQLEKAAEKVEALEEIQEPLNKLAQLGFSEQEIEQLSEVDSGLLHKVASVATSPASMGSGAGFAREKTDPLLEFILS